MNAMIKKKPSEEGRVLLETLQRAVSQALERKRRLGQYAVIWKDGKPIKTGEDVPLEKK
ncbi:MAG: hypothetical protein ACYC9I_06795 [Desulfuromonadales bacterium]